MYIVQYNYYPLVSGLAKKCWIGVHDSYANPITLTMIDLTEASVYTIPSLYMYHFYSEYTVSLSNYNWLILSVVVIFRNLLIPFESVSVIVWLRKKHFKNFAKHKISTKLF